MHNNVCTPWNQAWPVLVMSVAVTKVPVTVACFSHALTLGILTFSRTSGIGSPCVALHRPNLNDNELKNVGDYC